MSRFRYNAGIGILLVGCAHAPIHEGAVESPSAGPAMPTNLGAIVDSAMVVNHTEEILFPDPVRRTQYRLTILRDLIYRHSRSTGMLPDRLEPVVTPYKQDGATLVDAWNRPLVYTRRGKEYEIRSAGRDGLLNSDDDIVESGYAGVAPL